MKKEFKVKKSIGKYGKCLQKIFKMLKKKPEIINLNIEELPTKCIIIANHNGAGGPFNFRIFMKEHYMSWGAHQMTEGFNSRRRYLYHTFYRQKLGYGKFKAFLLSIGFGLVSPLPYGIAGTILVYYDARVKSTLLNSVKCIENDVPVFIFPEDSSKGYKKIIEKLFGGFLQLSKMYYKKHKVDLPIYILRYNNNPKQIVYGKPMYYQELAKSHTDKEILKIFLDYLNSLKAIHHKR